MARLAREDLFSPEEIAIVHVMNRTVRRCLLMGEDPLTKKNYDYRKAWLEQRIEQMAKYFGIDLLVYAVLSNHFHLVVRSRPDIVKTWDDTEVARRWCMLCPERKNDDGSPADPSEEELNLIRFDAVMLAEVRRRLSDISWLMRLVCQQIAQRINRADGETGRVWNRFKAVRLLDEEALLACAAYVDLNPIRAGLAEKLEDSPHTSIKKRIEALASKESTESNELQPPAADRYLAPLHLDSLRDALQIYPSTEGHRCSDLGFLPINEAQYIELLDWTARQKAKDKSGFTPESAPAVFERLNLSTAEWSEMSSNFGKLFSLVAGKPQTVESHRSFLRKKRFRLPKAARELLTV